MAVPITPADRNPERVAYEPSFIEKGMPTFIAAIAVIGLYYPSSRAGIINNALWLGLGGFTTLCYAIFLFRKNGALSKGAFANIFIINGLIWLFTLFSPFKEYALGNSIIYLLISLLFVQNLKSVPSTKTVRGAFLLINLINVPFAVLLILSVPFVVDLTLQNYAAYYPELVPFMLELKKPVLTFASHSIAGFYFFIFFWLNFKTYQKKENYLYLVFALCYLILSVFLLSNTAFAYFVFGIGEISLYFIRKKPGAFLIATAATTGLCIFFLFINASTSVPFWTAVNAVFAFQGGGLSGRYSSSGDLAGILTFLRTNPISPIGMGYSPRLFYGDSGIILFFLRGSIFLTVSIYAGFWFFLRGNCISRSTSARLFIFFMLFEIGLSNMEYYRTLAFLPFIIVYLNGIDSDQMNRRNEAS